MPAVYLHLSGRDVDKRLLEHRGLLEPEERLEEEKKPLKPVKCPRCRTVNPADAKFCFNCSMSLTVEAVAELMHTDDLMNRLLEDPETQDFLRNKLREMQTRKG